jgi:hypothetical protein
MASVLLGVIPPGAGQVTGQVEDILLGILQTVDLGLLFG